MYNELVWSIEDTNLFKIYLDPDLLKRSMWYRDRLLEADIDHLFSRNSLCVEKEVYDLYSFLNQCTRQIGA